MTSIISVASVLLFMQAPVIDTYMVEYRGASEATITYEEILDEAIFNCPNRNPNEVDQELLEKLISIEKKYKVPNELRGMLLSAACMESGYNPVAKGDYRIRGKRKRPMAIGILQQWPWYESKKAYNIDRKDPMQAADAWMAHVIKQLKKVKKLCKFRTTERIWKAAWVTAIRYPKAGGRCKESPNHWRLLQRWHKKIRKNREIIKDDMLNDLDGDGC
jgi:hypothetical protein